MANWLTDAGNPLVLFAGTSAGVYKTTDGARNWQPANNGLGKCAVSKFALETTFGAAQTLYAGTFDCGVFKSTDGGANWRPANLTLNASHIQALTLSPRAPQTLYAGASGSEAFVAQASPAGALLFASYLGGGNYENGAAIAVDGAGSLTVGKEQASGSDP